MNSFQARTTTLGFIGLGSMGSRVVARLPRNVELVLKASAAGTQALDVAISGSTPQRNSARSRPWPEATRTFSRKLCPSFRRLPANTFT